MSTATETLHGRLADLRRSHHAPINDYYVYETGTPRDHCVICRSKLPCGTLLAAEALTALVEEAKGRLVMASMGVAFVLAAGDWRTARETAKKAQPDLDAALAMLGEAE